MVHEYEELVHDNQFILYCYSIILNNLLIQ